MPDAPPPEIAQKNSDSVAHAVLDEVRSEFFRRVGADGVLEAIRQDDEKGNAKRSWSWAGGLPEFKGRDQTSKSQVRGVV